MTATTPDFDRDEIDPQKLTRQRVAVIAAWCQEVNNPDYESPLVAEADALATLGDRLRDAFIAEHGCEPTDAEYLDLYLKALGAFGYRWDEATFDVQPKPVTPSVTGRDPWPGDDEALAIGVVLEELPEQRTWFLSEKELAATRAKISALNERASAKGFNGNVEVTATPATRSHTPAADAPTVTAHGFDVTITGAPPQYDGWRFLAAVDRVERPGRTFAVDQPPYYYWVQALVQQSDDWVPAAFTHEIEPRARLRYDVFEVGPAGQQNPIAGYRYRFQADERVQKLAAAYQATGTPLFPQQPLIVLRYPPGAQHAIDTAQIRPGECDHCHTKRPRSTTFLVEQEQTGHIMQVGRSCLKDFLGHSTRPVFLDVGEIGRVIDSGLDSGTRTWDLVSVLTYAWAVIETHGWAPSSSPRATRDLVADAMLGIGKNSAELLDSIADKLPEGHLMAPRIITEVTSRLDTGNPYQANLLAIVTGGTVDRRKHLGLAVSAITCWRRLNQTLPAPEPDPAEPRTLSYAGSVGDKVTLTGTVTTVAFIDGYTYDSPSQRLIVIDCGAHIAKTITSAAWAYQVQRGATLTVTGTVKAHQEYRDIPQTVLSRPRRCDPPATPDPATSPQQAAAEPLWEVVKPVTPQSRFQTIPMATGPTAAPPRLTI